MPESLASILWFEKKIAFGPFGGQKQKKSLCFPAQKKGSRHEKQKEVFQ